MKRLRIAHLVSHPSQYMAPVYREIAKNPQVDFVVYFYSDASLGKHFDPGFGTEFQWSTDLLEGYRHRFLPSTKGKRVDKALQWPNWDLLKEIYREKFDVLWINSYAAPTSWLARIAAIFTRTAVFFRDDTNLLTPRPWWKRLVKDVFLLIFLRGAGALYVGAENRAYWRFYGVAEKRLFFTPHCVDNGFWSSQAQRLRPHRNEIRRSFGITDDAPVILFCGKFIPKKQPLALLSAFAEVRKELPCWLLMVGDGPLSNEFARQARELEMNNVVMPGFLNQDELPLAYSAADVFVLPSADHETWGMVVNEAMNFGLPIVVSNRVGCARDLLKEGVNGFSFEYDDERQLAHVLRRLVEDAALRTRFGASSAQLITKYSVEACAAGLIHASRTARPSRR